MEFRVNHPVLFVMTAVVIGLIMLQSVSFLRRAIKRAGELGIEKGTIGRVIKSSIIFTIAPAIAIVIGVITLSKDLGLPLPWLRLSVVGSLSYETIAASNALRAMGRGFGSGDPITAQQYVTVLFVMTISILGGIFLVSLIGKRLHKGMEERAKKDKTWSEIFTNAMFIGMIAAFIGFIFGDVGSVGAGNTAGLIPVCVFFVAMIAVLLCAFLMKKLKWNWLNDYALPIALLCGMASAIPLTAWLG